ncbi:hypothetical protein [Amycolatopsis sp. cg9]|uniref:DUF6919 domain-containing protein n=1 Tax=Amycolatopsis sp. cg9 TaxID=3238801 RepID=UPI00352456B4
MKRMARADRERWYAARDLRDLGRLTALWLEGAIESQPGYEPGFGPDEETAELVPVLARANRAGYVTDASQPGRAPGTGFDGATWAQRAAVEGWIAPDRSSELIDVAQQAGLIVITNTVLNTRFARRCRDFIDVTRRAEQVCTGFGTQRRASEIRFQYDECHRDAINAVIRSRQVTIAAPDYGPDHTVWEVVNEWSVNNGGVLNEAAS